MPICLFESHLSWLRHHERGRVPDPSRVDSIDKFQPSQSKKKLYAFLKFASYFRRFMSNSSAKTSPLRALVARDADFIWTEIHSNIVNDLTRTLSSPPIIANFRNGCPTTIYIDASPAGLGAVLIQVQEERERVIEYASCSVNEQDSKLHSNALECMALHWAVTKKCAIFVSGGPRFTVVTDNISFTYLLKQGTVIRRFARWTLDLAEYEFNLVHRSGKQQTRCHDLTCRIAWKVSSTRKRTEAHQSAWRLC